MTKELERKHDLYLPLEVDGVKNDGDYGLGDDVHSGFTSYAVSDARGYTILDSLNADWRAGEVQEELDEYGHSAWDELARRRTDEIVRRVNTYDQRFVDGLVAMREMLARFVEHGGNPVVAHSMRLNWNPEWGPAPDPERPEPTT